MINSLTGVRFFAAVWVLLFHLLHVQVDFWDMRVGRVVEWGIFERWMSMGYMSVDLFFVLSGFVMTYAHGKDFADHLAPKAVFRYIALRIARIYPLHLVIIAYLLVLHYAKLIPGGVPNPWGLGYQLSLTQAWVPADRFHDLTWNLPAWSISAEFMAYLQFPIGIYLLRRFHVRGVALWGLIAAIVAFYYHRFEATPYHFHLGLDSLLRVTCGFWMGVALHELWASGRLSAIRWDSVVFGILLLGTAFYAVPFPARTTMFVLGALMVVALAQSKGWAAKFFGHRRIVFLGVISYGVYLLHYPVILSIWGFGRSYCEAIAERGGWAASAFLVGVIALITLLSAAAYYWIEAPARNILRRWVDAVTNWRVESRSTIAPKG